MTGPVTGFADRSDEELVGIYADASRPRGVREAAFRALVARYQRRVFAVCFRVLHSTSDAEDAAQETFIKLARGAAGFRGDAKLSTWLYRVARNVCTDRIRHDARRPSTPTADLTTVGEPSVAEDLTEAHATGAAIEDALDQLDPRSRQLLLLIAVEELSYAEAAEVVDLPIGTVKSRVSRARATLGRILAETSDPAPRPSGVGTTPTTGAPRTAGHGPRAPPGSADPAGS